MARASELVKSKPAGKSAAGRPVKSRREKILEVAIAEFSKNGFDGARMDRIAELAGVNKNLIYHHYQSKDVLFQNALETVYVQMREQQDRWTFSELPPKEAIAKLTILTFEHFAKHPETINLINSENQHKARHMKKSASVPQLYPALISAIEDILKRGQEEKVFRQNVDPIELYVSIQALGYNYLSNRHTLQTIFGQDFTEPKRLQQRMDHTVEVILGYLRP